MYSTMRTRNRKIRNKVAKTLPYLFFVLLGLLYIRGQTRDRSLQKHKFITTGEVIYFSRDYRGTGGSFDFVYVVNGRRYKKSSSYPSVDKSEGYRFVGRRFPVVVDSTNFRNSRILLTSKAFSNYDLPLPDSLEWVKQYERQ